MQKVTFYGTEIRMEYTKSYGHYRLNQFDRRGNLIFTTVITDSLAFDDYNDVRSEACITRKEITEKLHNVRATLQREKSKQY